MKNGIYNKHDVYNTLKRLIDDNVPDPCTSKILAILQQEFSEAYYMNVRYLNVTLFILNREGLIIRGPRVDRRSDFDFRKDPKEFDYVWTLPARRPSTLLAMAM